MNTRFSGFWALLSIVLVGVAPSGRAVAPQIDYQPQSKTNILYQQVAFGVIARGTEPLSYQWRKEGITLLGATNDQLILPNPRFADAGSYSVVVSNPESSVTSLNATLLVQAPKGGDVDCSFVNGGLIDGPVQSIAVQQDGKVLIAGQFRTVSGGSRGGVARLNTNGTTDFTFMNGLSGADGVVNSLALQSDGKVLLGGRFTRVNGISRTNIARLNPDGSLDATFQDGLSGVSGSTSANPASVNSLAQLADGKILIGGLFTNVNGISQNNIAQLNIDGTLDTTFRNPLSDQGSLTSIAVQSDGRVLIGGLFVTVDGLQRTNIARLNADGSLDTSFQNGLSGVNGAVFCMSVQTDSKVLIGGAFNTVNGVSSTNFARLNADGTFDTGFQSGLSGGNAVYAVTPQTDGKILIGGSFLSVSGLMRNRIARLNPDGTLDAGFQEGLSGANEVVYAFASRSDGVLVGGNFTMINGVAACRVTRLFSDGTVGEDFRNSVAGPNGRVSAIELQKDGKVLIAGTFSVVHNVPRSSIARLNIDGSLDAGFQNSLPGVTGSVSAMKLQSDGKVIIAGGFRTVNGVGRTNIARLNPDGSLDATFQNGLSGAFGWVYSVAVDTNGKIIIGGFFSRVNGISRLWIARLNPDGILDEGFQPSLLGIGAPFGVACIAIQPDGKLLIGGDFTSINGTTRNRIARLNSDGSLDTGFQPAPYGADNTVFAIAIQSDGKVLIGGWFNSVNGNYFRRGIARLNSDGTLDNGFNIIWGGIVHAIAVQNDAKIILGGSFTPRRIARLQADGTALDASFQNGLAGANSDVYSIALQSNDGILIGGRFNTVNGLPASGIARLWPTAEVPPLITSINRNGESANLTWDAIPNRTCRVQYNDLLSPTNWASLSGDVLTPATGIGVKADSAVSGVSQRLYRVVLLP